MMFWRFENGTMGTVDYARFRWAWVALIGISLWLGDPRPAEAQCQDSQAESYLAQSSLSFLTASERTELARAMDHELHRHGITTDAQRGVVRVDLTRAMSTVASTIRPVIGSPCPAWSHDAVDAESNQVRSDFLGPEKAEYEQAHQDILTQIDYAVREYLVEAARVSIAVRPLAPEGKAHLDRQIDQLLVECKAVARPYFETHRYGLQLLDRLVARERARFEESVLRHEGGLAGTTQPGWRPLSDAEFRSIQRALRFPYAELRKAIDLSFLTGNADLDDELFAERSSAGDNMVNELAQGVITEMFRNMSDTRQLSELLQARLDAIAALAKRHHDLDAASRRSAEARQWTAVDRESKRRWHARNAGTSFKTNGADVAGDTRDTQRDEPHDSIPANAPAPTEGRRGHWQRHAIVAVVMLFVVVILLRRITRTG